MTALILLGGFTLLAVAAAPVCYGAIVGWRALDAWLYWKRIRPAAPAAPRRRRRAHA